MRSHFEEFFAPTEADIEHLWQSAIIIPDTSALLSLFRYDPTSAAEVILAFESLKDRLMLPHQVGVEFYRNQARVQKESGDQFTDLKTAINKINRFSKESFDELAKIRMPSFNISKYRSIILAAVGKLKAQQEQDLRNYDDKKEHALILEKIEAMFGARVQTQQNLAELAVIAERRFNAQIPPGYMDEDKSQNRFGDVVVWLEVISIASRLASSVIFVTDDEKKDWWSTTSASNEMPRPELIKEFRDITKHNIWIYKLPTFLNAARAKKFITIEGKTLTEIMKQDVEQKKIKLAMLHRFCEIYQAKCSEASKAFGLACSENSLTAIELHSIKAQAEYRLRSAYSEIKYLEQYIEAKAAGKEPLGLGAFFSSRHSSPIPDELLYNPYS